MGKKIFLICCVIGFILLNIISITSAIIYEFTGELFFLSIFSTGGIVVTGVSLVIYCIIGTIKLILEDYKREEK